jgi:lipoprotein-releasing system permease protein
MSFEYFIGRRYLKTRQTNLFISLITILSIAGVTLGVTALIVVIAVMAGFESDLKSRILSVESHILVLRHGGAMEYSAHTLKAINQIEGVDSSMPYIFTQVMLRSSAGISGAVLRGIDPSSAGKVIASLPAEKLLPKQDPPEDNITSTEIPGIILGKELAKSLRVIKGDIIYVISPKGMVSPVGHIPSMKRFRIVDLFESGMYEFDGSFAFINLFEAQKILRLKNAITGIDVRVDDVYQAARIKQAIVDKLGFPFWARDWMQMNHNLFSALKLEKTVMFIILTLIVLVAAFNIASSLIMMVMQKTRDIAILKTMGATDSSIRKIFVFKGILVGSIGTFLGVVLGSGLCYLLKRYKFIDLPSDVYYITTLPVQLEALDVFLIASAAMVICFIATIYPAHHASKLNPVDAIRYG